MENETGVSPFELDSSCEEELSPRHFDNTHRHYEVDDGSEDESSYHTCDYYSVKCKTDNNSSSSISSEEDNSL
jgi:hypothetical protein